jgi:hypothetical protein
MRIIIETLKMIVVMIILATGVIMLFGSLLFENTKVDNGRYKNIDHNDDW